MRSAQSTQTSAPQRHRTTPIPNSISTIPDYPSKLVIYRLEASSYWWVRYFAAGKILRRSTKTDNKSKAYAFAKDFYEEIIIKKRQGLAVTNRAGFETCLAAMIKAQASQLERGEITQITHDNTKYRLFKTVLPFFRMYDAAAISYEVLEEFLHNLSTQKPKLSLSTINAYMKLVRRVLNEGVRRGILTHLPQFPRVGSDDQPRGYFTVKEYRKLWTNARQMRGKSYDILKVASSDGKGGVTQYVAVGQGDNGRLIRRVKMSEDLPFLITFMVNSFIRPTDIKNLQHKHVENVRNDNVYLRLRLPPSKKHKDPIVTMPKAVKIYQRLRAYHAGLRGEIKGEDYVFSPQFLKRGHALKEFQRQFDLLLRFGNMQKGARGEARSIYSLRHTCFMFRLMYGERMDLITLARNARTSPEMIDRFYAAQMKGEDNVEMLQSRRKRKGRK